MFNWHGTHQTNGATANVGVGGFSTATARVPVVTVSENVLVALRGLIHYFPQQAHSVGAASGFAPAARYASPMVSAHESFGSNFSYQCLLVLARCALLAVRKRHFLRRVQHQLLHTAILFRGGDKVWDNSSLDRFSPKTLPILG